MAGISGKTFRNCSTASRSDVALERLLQAALLQGSVFCL